LQHLRSRPATDKRYDVTGWRRATRSPRVPAAHSTGQSRRRRSPRTTGVGGQCRHRCRPDPRRLRYT
jgi:hypothetical protein